MLHNSFMTVKGHRFQSLDPDLLASTNPGVECTLCGLLLTEKEYMAYEFLSCGDLVCDCGAAKLGYKPYTPGHSRWCKAAPRP